MMWAYRIKLMAMGGVTGSLLVFTFNYPNPITLMALTLSLVAVWLEFE